jgi:hypothetical protein
VGDPQTQEDGAVKTRAPLAEASSLETSPEQKNSFTPRRWLRGGHVQTIASFLIGRRLRLPKHEERIVEVEPGVRVLCHCHWQRDRASALTVVIVHGLEGSSDSQYMLGVTGKAMAAGMNVIRYNQRNCGGTEALAPVLYHSGLSEDVAAVAKDIISRDKISRLALVGFSMGGNIVLKLAGEWGSRSNAPPQLKAVVAVCPAIDLATSSDALHERGNRVYEKYFLWALRRRLRQKARLFPGQFDVKRLRGVQSLREFDDKVTAYYCGFTGVEDYYDRASSSHVIGKISVPSLILYAANDPFVKITNETRRKIASNKNIRFVETHDGGHCAFIGASQKTLGNAKGNDGFWAEHQIVDFLRPFNRRT